MSETTATGEAGGWNHFWDESAWRRATGLSRGRRPLMPSDAAYPAAAPALWSLDATDGAGLVERLRMFDILPDRRADLAHLEQAFEVASIQPLWIVPAAGLEGSDVIGPVIVATDGLYVLDERLTSFTRYLAWPDITAGSVEELDGGVRSLTFTDGAGQSRCLWSVVREGECDHLAIASVIIEKWSVVTHALFAPGEDPGPRLSDPEEAPQAWEDLGYRLDAVAGAGAMRQWLTTRPTVADLPSAEQLARRSPRGTPGRPGATGRNQ